MSDRSLARTGSAMSDRGIYTTPSICVREGHVQSRDIAYIPATHFCKECGAKTISTCPSCAEAIHGTMGRHPSPYEPPNYCHNCGSMYPWTALRIEAAKALIIESDDSASAHEAAASIPDLVVPSETSRSSIEKVKDWMKRATPVVARGAWDLLAPIITSEAKARLGLPT